MRKLTVQFLFIFTLLGLSNMAFAHSGHDISGLSAGLMHPFSGFDHLLAMIAVGLWATQIGGWKIGLLPATFMLMMFIGAKCALIYSHLPLIEVGIAVSVLALGIVTALSLKLSARLCITITAIFGLFHGYAHGLEMSEATQIEAYAMGFLMGTITLHLTGIMVGIATRTHFAQLPRVLGTLIAIIGLWQLSSI
jgi:urease accessory protein